MRAKIFGLHRSAAGTILPLIAHGVIAHLVQAVAFAAVGAKSVRYRGDYADCSAESTPSRGRADYDIEHCCGAAE